MNQLRINNLFDIDPFDDSFGAFLRPWKVESVAKVPKIKIDLTEHDDNYAIKAESPGRAQKRTSTCASTAIRSRSVPR